MSFFFRTSCLVFAIISRLAEFVMCIESVYQFIENARAKTSNVFLYETVHANTDYEIFLTVPR